MSQAKKASAIRQLVAGYKLKRKDLLAGIVALELAEYPHAEDLLALRQVAAGTASLQPETVARLKEWMAE